MGSFLEDDKAERRMLLRAVRGSASTMILTMLLFPELHGEVELASACGMNRKTVRRCLTDLAGLGIVLRGDRYRGWCLGPGVRQMVLGEGDGERLPIEGYILPIASSSSSTHDMKASSKGSETTTTGDGESLPIGVGWGECVEKLVGVGCSPAAAKACVSVAAGRGESEVVVGKRLDGWLLYCGSERGAGIRAPGFLSAARVGAGIDAPVVEMSRDELAWEQIRTRYDEIVQH